MKIKGGGKWACLFLGFLILFILVLYLIVVNSQPKLLDVSFLDVGQGDASLIETPFGQNILIDAGEGNKVAKGLGKELGWWDRQIDLLILTHPHSDHLGGMIDVLRRYNVVKVLYTGVESEEADFSLFKELIIDEKAEIVIINNPQKIILGESCNLEILFPFDKKILNEQKNLNNTSIVAKLRFKETSFLFAGDMEEVMEKQLIERKSDIRADVLKVGHHGSDTSSHEEFLQAIEMDYSIVSVGKENDFGHPSLRVLRRMERNKSKIYRTDISGTINMQSDGRYVYVLK